MKSLNVIGLGALNIDFLHKIPNSDITTHHETIRNTTIQAGGAASNTICSLSRLGLTCGITGRTGQDKYAKLLIDNLDHYGVDYFEVAKDHRAQSGQAQIFISNTGKSHVYINPGANSYLERRHLDMFYMKDADWIHYTSFLNEKQIDAQLKVAVELKDSSQSSYYIDAHMLPFGWKIIKKLITNIRHIIIDDSVLTTLTGYEGNKGAGKLVSLGCQTVSIIKCPWESELVTKKASIRSKLKQKVIQDTAGIQDAFCAGFIYGQIKGYSLKKTALLSHALMTLCSQSVGCRTYISNSLSKAKLVQQMCLLKEDKNILIVGSGGREHAIAWKLHQSPNVHRLYVAPGNTGISQVARIVPITDQDISGLKDFVKKQDIDLTIVGPEAPLSMGIVDEFEKDGLAVFGPSKKAAMLETSKSFAKKFMKKFHIPTAKFKVFKRYKSALSFVNNSSYPLVVKADGLAGGKGVRVCKNKDEAQEWLKILMVEKNYNSAGKKVVIEKCLRGQEASLLAFTDGIHIVPLLPAQDHKPLLNNDKGPNTGGMGAYAPAPLITPKLLETIHKKILQPTISGMRKIKRIYKGIIYLGLMITKNGPKVIEYNCRLGDPETQAILPLLETDLLQLIEATLLGNLHKIKVSWKRGACVCVIVASGGYPGKSVTGDEIKGLKNLAKFPHADAFHSGTDSKIVTAGGRVLGVYATGNDLKDAMKKAYAGVKHVKFPWMHSRGDIGKKGLK